jgi:hypothetical protein
MKALIYCPNKGFIYRAGRGGCDFKMITSQIFTETSIEYSIKWNE